VVNQRFWNHLPQADRALVRQAMTEALDWGNTIAQYENDEALAAMLDAPLEKWRVFLHPSQRKIVERDWNGPVRVLGGAGTGKTVVAMHRTAWLVQNRFKAEDDRILFTTYTQNLAADIADNLAKLLPAPALRQVEVINLDKWVASTLKKYGYDYRIAYWDGGTDELGKLWKQALTSVEDLPFEQSFYREEWDYVVQPLGCQAEEDYLKARREGRGVRLSRGQRKAIWAVFRTYRDLLEENGLRESVDAMRDAEVLLKKKGATQGYRAIVVDEAQDMSTPAFRLLRFVAGERRENDLFIVGDAHQRIYRRKVVLGQAGIDVVGRSRRLRINYRTTDEIRRHAVAVLEGVTVDDLDNGEDTLKGTRSLVHGAPPRLEVAKDQAAEVEAIVAFVKAGDPAQTCLVARTNNLLDEYTERLQKKGITCYRVKRSKAEERSTPGLRIATMHRVKGLEFDRVVVAGANVDVLPLKSVMRTSKDKAVLADLEQQERALLYVAITRARREVLITCSGKPSAWITGKNH